VENFFRTLKRGFDTISLTLDKGRSRRECRSEKLQPAIIEDNAADSEMKRWTGWGLGLLLRRGILSWDRL